jgi:peroxiredoxin
VCNDEVHEMVAFHNAHRDRDASVLGIAIDGIEEKAAVQAFIDRNRVSFPNLIDDGSAIVTEFSRKVGESWFGWTPTYLVYNPQGRLTAKQIGAVSRQDLERHILEQTGSARR